MLQIKFEAEAFHGLGKTHGILNMDDDKVVVEYQTQDSFVGFIKSGIKRVVVTADKLADIELRKRFLSLLLSLKARSMTVFDGIPFAAGSLLAIKLKKNNFDELFIAVQRVKARIQEFEIRRMENG